ncbi:MAG: molecular chaperone TorD family protein [Smithellaceae bacterium]|nr:molecular chaperone TorD family protein [Smithellaceae bacterium]
MTREEIIFREGLRAQVYQILSVCFCQPERDLLDQSVFNTLGSALDVLSPEASSLARTMAECHSGYSDQEMIVEYARLFLGPFKIPAPPYGSVYLEQAGLLMGESTIEVSRFYQEQGLSLPEDTKDMPDHIAAELEFMYFLLSSGRTALVESDLERAGGFIRAGQLFLARFLLPFAVPFSEAIEKETTNGFYRALAGCLRAFLSADQAYTDQLVEELSVTTP